MLEANRFWFYSLVFSIVWSCLQLFRGDAGKREVVEKEKKTNLQKLRVATENRQRLRKQIAVDCFDLFVPGLVTGWIQTSLATAGCAAVVSTSLSLNEMWSAKG